MVLLWTVSSRVEQSGRNLIFTSFIPRERVFTAADGEEYHWHLGGTHLEVRIQRWDAVDSSH
jgi:hypothetical protein